MKSLAIENQQNILPYNGIAFYFGKILSYDDSIRFYNLLISEIPWTNDVLKMFGKQIVTKRKVAWFADEPYEYSYSNSIKTASIWTKDLGQLKQIVETVSGETFNSCLLNLYHSGDEGMGWHSDAEKELKKEGAIASLSLGAQRKFMFRHKQTKEVISLDLEDGGLLLMKGQIQSHWQHRLPPSRKITSGRINLTFRTIRNDQ